MASPPPGRITRLFWRWHRRVGLVVLLLALVLSGTGIALNHTESLALDQRHVAASWLLDWYGIEVPADALSYEAGGHRVTLLGDRLYFDATPLEGSFDRLSGAGAAGGGLAVVAGGNVLLLNDEGALIERMGRTAGVPAGIERVAVGPDGRLFVEAAHGLYVADPQFLGWQHEAPPAAGLDWAAPSPLPETLLQRLRTDLRGQILPLERVLLDVHSGRILGRHGPLVMDLAAVLLILLALSGGWMWLRRRPSGR